MLKWPGFLCLCAVALGAANGAAQIRSGSTAVTLVATVRESFSVFPTEFQLSERQHDGRVPAARGVYALLSWRLRPARNFRLQWELENPDAPAATRWRSELLTLRQVAAQSARMSFVGKPSSDPVLLTSGERVDDAPAGFSGVVLMLPPQSDFENAVLRIKVVVL